MSDTSYPIEIKLASANGYHTPTQAKAYYGRYARDGIAIHWWGNGRGADGHDELVNYELGQAQAGNKSVNYVVSDAKITLVVNPDNVAWCTFSWNPTTISVEIQPTLGAEGYKKMGWLIDQLRQRYSKELWIKGHNTLIPNSTACPGSLNLPLMEAEAQKWRSGAYDAPPTPTYPPKPVPPTPSTITLRITDIPNKKVKLVRDANLWDLHFAKYPDAKVVKSFPAGTQIEVSAIAKHPLGSSYYLSEYSFSKGVGNGINVKDCEDVTVPPPTVEPPAPIPTPIPVAEPDRTAILAFLTMLRDLITNFLGRFK